MESLAASPVYAFRFASSCAGQAVLNKYELARRSSSRNEECRRGKALSRSYGRFFAEFLNHVSLVRLGLLDLLTCVGLWYG